MRSIGLGALDFRRETYGAMLKRQPGKPVLNLDFLLQTVIERLMPLDWNTFWARNQLIPLKVRTLSSPLPPPLPRFFPDPEI